MKKLICILFIIITCSSCSESKQEKNKSAFTSFSNLFPEQILKDTLHMYVNASHDTLKTPIDTTLINQYYLQYKNTVAYYPISQIKLNDRYQGFVLAAEYLSDLSGKIFLIEIYDKQEKVFKKEPNIIAKCLGEAGAIEGLESWLLDYNQDGDYDIIQRQYYTYQDPGETNSIRQTKIEDFKLFLFKEGNFVETPITDAHKLKVFELTTLAEIISYDAPHKVSQSSDEDKPLDSTQTTQYKQHCGNKRETNAIDYCIQLPNIFELKKIEYQIGISETFEAKDKSAELVFFTNVQDQMFVIDEGFEKYYKSYKKVTIESGSKVTYTAQPKNAYIISGIDKEGYIFYEKLLLKDDSQVILASLRYKPAQKDFYGKLIKPMFDSFQ